MRALIASLVVLFAAAAVSAGPRARRAAYYTPQAQSAPAAYVPTGPATDALDELNAARAARGLPAYLPDPNLTAAAKSCAETRAAYLVAGHTQNDFAALPFGTSAGAAGCGAMESSWGWQSCCAWDRWTYAGAAVVTGRDGKRYMHLFVR